MSTNSDFPLDASGTPRKDLVQLLLPAVWALLLAAVFVGPRLFPPADLGDDLTRNTVRVSLVFWFPAVCMMMGLDEAGWRAATTTGKSVRWCWTLALVAYLIHLVTAMHYYHGWSHADAMEHVERASGFGPGIFFSHLFTLLWTADATWWWLDREKYCQRSRWIDRSLHCYMAFIIFDATVVYEGGAIRRVGVVMFAGLTVGLVRKLMKDASASAACG
jgi:hypothetical protein